MLSQPEVSIIGGGNVGAELAYALVLLQIGVEVVLYNRSLDKAEGAAWDIEDAMPLLSEMKVTPTDRCEDLAASDVVVITVGAPRLSVRADPAYGIGSEVVLGLPCIIGEQGIERQLILLRN